MCDRLRPLFSLSKTTHLSIKGSDDVISQGVSVGIEEAVGVIDDCPAVVPDGKRGGGAGRRNEPGDR